MLGSPVTATSTQEIEAFLAEEKARGLGPGSLKITVYGLKAFFGFLKRRHLANHDPTLILRAPRVPLLLPAVLNEPETAQLMAVDFTKRPAKPKPKLLPLRDRAILEILYATGIRNSELITAKLQNLDLEARTLRVLGKGSKERMVVFGRPAAMALAEYLQDERKRRVARARHMTNRDREAIFYLGMLRRLPSSVAGRSCRKHVFWPGSKSQFIRIYCDIRSPPTCTAMGRIISYKRATWPQPI